MSWGELILGIVAGLILGQFLPAYFKRKGENLATQEDLARLTEIAEGVKTQHQLLLERTKPFTAEETLKRTAFFNAKLEAFHGALEVVYRKFSANVLLLDGEKESYGPASGVTPTEVEINLAYGRMAMFASEREVLDRYRLFHTSKSSAADIGALVALMRKDLGFADAVVDGGAYGYIVGTERPRPPAG